jgi:hypothetical protein
MDGLDLGPPRIPRPASGRKKRLLFFS